MKRILLTALCLLSTLPGQETLNIRGYVKDIMNKGITDVKMTLKHKQLSTYTNEYGRYQFDENTSIATPGVIAKQSVAHISSSGIEFNLQSPDRVSIDLFQLNGRRIPLFSEELTSGKHMVAPDKLRSVAQGVYILRMKIGTQVYTTKFAQGRKTELKTGLESTPVVPGIKTRRSTGEYIDTLVISKEGYRPRNIPIKTYDDYLSFQLASPDMKYEPDYFLNDNRNSLGYLRSDEWTDIIWGGEESNDSVTSVLIHPTKDLDTSITITLIEKERQSSADWKAAVAGTWFWDSDEISIGKRDDNFYILDRTGFIVVDYEVENSDDTLAFYLTHKEINDSALVFKINYTDTIDGTEHHYSAFRAVLTSGADNPGERVQDTLTFDDFTLKYGHEDPLLMNLLGFSVNSDGHVYLSENIETKNFNCIAFQSESEVSGIDTLTFTLYDLYALGEFRPEEFALLPLIESNGWNHLSDPSSEVKSSWANDITTLSLTRGASDEDAGKWPYAAAHYVVNPKGNFGNLKAIHIEYVYPPEGDTIALSLERGECLGADSADNWKYGSFRVLLPPGYEDDWAKAKYSEYRQPGDTVSDLFFVDLFTMNWGDDPNAAYQLGDTIDQAFLNEANAIAFFSEKDNGKDGGAADGDSVSLTILNLKLVGKSPFLYDILPRTNR